MQIKTAMKYHLTPGTSQLVLLPRYYSDSKESTCNAGDLGMISGLGSFPEEGNATHSNILACRIPWREEPGGYSPWGHRDSDMTQ